MGGGVKQTGLANSPKATEFYFPTSCSSIKFIANHTTLNLSVCNFLWNSLLCGVIPIMWVPGKWHVSQVKQRDSRKVGKQCVAWQRRDAVSLSTAESRCPGGSLCQPVTFLETWEVCWYTIERTPQWPSSDNLPVSQLGLWIPENPSLNTHHYETE